MKKSDIQFSKPSLTKLNFTLNSNFKNKDSNCIIPIKSSIGNNILEPCKEAIVSLNLIVGQQEEANPFYLELEIAAKFINESGDEELFAKMVEQNGPALLLSYARPIVSLITSQSGLPAFNLPFINFVKDEETRN